MAKGRPLLKILHMRSEVIVPISIGPKALSLTSRRGRKKIAIDRIIRMEAESNYTCIHIMDQRPVLMARVLGDYEAVLEPFGFVRTHRSHLVNRQYVRDINTSGEIIMIDQSKAEISRRKRKTVLGILNLAYSGKHADIPFKGINIAG